jgi:hypothetical protein
MRGGTPEAVTFSSVSVQSRCPVHRFSLSLLLIVACSLLGCGVGQHLRVESIQVGRSINPNGSIASMISTFGPQDTVYVSVNTTGAGSGTLGVRWKFGETVIGESQKPVQYSGVASTEFHLQSATGFPPGDYSVEVLLNGQSVGSRPFHVVKKP